MIERGARLVGQMLSVAAVGPHHGCGRQLCWSTWTSPRSAYAGRVGRSSMADVPAHGTPGRGFGTAARRFGETRSARSLTGSARSSTICKLHAQAGGASAKGEAMESVPPLGLLRTEMAKLLSEVQAVEEEADLPTLRSSTSAAEHESASPDLWLRPSEAERSMQRLSRLRERLGTLETLHSAASEAELALELAELDEEGADEERGGGWLGRVGEGRQGKQEDERDGEKSSCPTPPKPYLPQAWTSLRHARELLRRWCEAELTSSHPLSGRPAALSIQAGAGGMDAQDWAGMLERMYGAWAARRGLRVRCLDRQAGEQGGVRWVQLEVEGESAFGLLRGERGTHRLVRNSPFHAKHARQTSFAAVDVVPLEEGGSCEKPPQPEELREADLETSTMRASGPGGQSVNKVESAVRIKHLPTGLSARCQSERSQAANRAQALRLLRAKLQRKRAEEAAARDALARGEAPRAQWGEQVRSYVLHPYALVRDHRSGLSLLDAQAVLDGDLDALVASVGRWLREREKGEG